MGRRSTIDLAYYVNDELEGEKLVKKNDAYAFIIIPRHFQKNVLKGNYTTVSCSYNGQYLLSGAIILKDFQTVAQTFLAGVVLETLEEKGLSERQAMGSILPINTDIHVLYNPYTSYSYYLNIAFMPMALQIMVMIMSIYTFGLVLKQKKGQELLAKAGGNVYVAILGKILPYTVIFFTLGFLMNCLLYYKIGTPLKASFIGVNVLIFVFIIVCQCLALFIASITTSFRTALTLAGEYITVGVAGILSCFNIDVIHCFEILCKLQHYVDILSLFYFARFFRAVIGKAYDHIPRHGIIPNAGDLHLAVFCALSVL